MPKFIKVTMATSGAPTLLNTTWIVEMQPSTMQAGTFLTLTSGSNVEFYNITETFEEIMEMINGQ